MVRRGMRFTCRSSHGGSSLCRVPAKAKGQQLKQLYTALDASGREKVPSPMGKVAQPPASLDAPVIATDIVLSAKSAPEGRAGGVDMLAGWPELAAVPLAHVLRCRPSIHALASPVQLCQAWWVGQAESCRHHCRGQLEASVHSAAPALPPGCAKRQQGRPVGFQQPPAQRPPRTGCSCSIATCPPRLKWLYQLGQGRRRPRWWPQRQQPLHCPSG